MSSIPGTARAWRRFAPGRSAMALSHDEQVMRFPFGESFGKGFVDGLYFSKTNVAGQTLYGYQNKSGKYVWIQPQGKNAVPPKWWRQEP
jgi:hypothetical protein